MQPEVTRELSNLYKVLFETRQKLEFLNQVYKLRGSLIQELLYPQHSSTQRCRSDTSSSSRSTSCLEKDSEKVQGCSKAESSTSLPPIDENKSETTFDFSHLDSLLQKAKMVRTTDKPDKNKKVAKPPSDEKEIKTGKEAGAKRAPGEVDKGNKGKQSSFTPRTNYTRASATPKSTYQSSYSRKPFQQASASRPVKRDPHLLPPLRPGNRNLEMMMRSTEEHSLHASSSPNISESHEIESGLTPQTIPTTKTRIDSTPLTFQPPSQPPPLPPQYVEAVNELKRAQVEIARLVKSDQTKIFSPGKEFMRQFEKLHRRDETPRDRQLYASLLYKEIEEGEFSSSIKKFFLDSLQSHLPPEESDGAYRGDKSRFVYPCPHCLDPKKASIEGIKVPKIYLLKNFNLCYLLSQCYPDTPLSNSRLAKTERLQCVDVDQLVQLHHLIVDVYSLSIKKDILTTCMKIVPQLDLNQREHRHALRIIVQILDSSKIVSFFNFSMSDN